MLGWFKNIGLSWKVQLAPAFLILVLIGVGVYALQALRSNQTAVDALTVRKMPVAVQFNEIGEDFMHIVQRVRALRMARDFGDAPGRQLGIDVLRELLTLAAELVDLFGDIDSRLRLYVTQFLDLGLKFGDRLFKIQKCSFCHRLCSWFAGSG